MPGEHAEHSERHLYLWALRESRCGHGRGLLSLQPSPKATKLYPKPQKGWERKEAQASPAAITKQKGPTTKAFKNKHCDSKQGGKPRAGATSRSSGPHQTSFLKPLGNCLSMRCLNDNREACLPQREQDPTTKASEVRLGLLQRHQSCLLSPRGNFLRLNCL